MKLIGNILTIIGTPFALYFMLLWGASLIDIAFSPLLPKNDGLAMESLGFFVFSICLIVAWILRLLASSAVHYRSRLRKGVSFS